MKLLVCVKRVIDAYVNIRVKKDGSGVETQNVKMSMNPFDEIAVEQAVRMKEGGLVEEIVVVSLGDDTCQETIRAALALGADRGCLVQTQESLEPLNIAKVLQVVAKKESPDLIIMGKQAIDNDCNQTGQMLAGLLGWSQGTFASKLEFKETAVEVTREVDGGLETLSLALPAVITTDLRLNEPRYASLPNIMQARSKPIDVIKLTELFDQLKPHLETLSVQTPPSRKKGVVLKSIQELISRLKNEVKVI